MLDTVVRWWFSRGDAHIWSSSIFYRWIFTYGMLDGVEIGVLDVFGWFDCMHRFCKLGVVNRMMDVREFPSFCLFFSVHPISLVFFSGRNAIDRFPKCNSHMDLMNLTSLPNIGQMKGDLFSEEKASRWHQVIQPIATPVWLTLCLDIFKH